MTVGTYSTHKEIYAPSLLNGPLVVLTFLYKVSGITIKNVNIFRSNVNMREEVIPHKAMIRLRMILRNVHIFVHVKRYDILERNLSRLIFFYQLFVQSQWRRASRTSQFERFLGSRVCLFYFFCHIVGSPFRHSVVVRFNNYSHNK